MEPVAGSLVHYAQQTLYILISDRTIVDPAMHTSPLRKCLFSSGLSHVMKSQSCSSNPHVRVLV